MLGISNAINVLTLITQLMSRVQQWNNCALARLATLQMLTWDVTRARRDISAQEEVHWKNVPAIQVLGQGRRTNVQIAQDIFLPSPFKIVHAT